MKYIEQTHDSLRLILNTEGDILPDFSVIATDTITFGRYTIDFGILAESHFVSVTRDAQPLWQEIFACTDAQIEIADTTFVDTLLLSTIKRDYEFAEYAFTAKRVTLMNGSTANALSMLNAPTDAATLLHTFPGQSTATPSAHTAIAITAGEQVTVTSIHTYPNEAIAVLTTSDIILK
jgi:hypothetical protein